MPHKKSSHIQSLIFPKSSWTLSQAKTWLDKHNYHKTVDEKSETYRFRQFDPNKNKSYRIKKIKHYSKPIELVLEIS